MNDLERFFTANTGGKIHKWMHYFEIYERHFARFRGTDVHVLEIGVAQGGSLRMWKDYFGPQARVYGVDIEPNTKALEEPRIEIMIGDQADADFLMSVVAAVPRIDILIDDGGHTMRQQEVTFNTLFPHVSDDGVYLCEDLHTSYWAEYGGGYKREGTFIERSKGLVDEINAWHSRSPRLVVSDFTKTAHSLHFYDSLLVIEKRQLQPPIEVGTSRAKRIATRVPGYGLADRVARRRWPAGRVRDLLDKL